MNQNEDTNFITNSNNATSINVDYSTNKLPLWAKKGLKIDYDDPADDRTNRSSTNNLVHNHRPNSISSTISSSTPISSSSSTNRTRISLYNSRSTDSDERNSVDDAQLNESPIERLKKKAQLLSTTGSGTIKPDKLNGGDHLNGADDLPSLQKKKNPLYVSTENLKFNDNHFFAKTPLPKAMAGATTVQLNSSHNKPSAAQKPAVLLNSSTPKIQLNSSASGSLNNSLNGSATLKAAASTSSINRPPAISKRREELASALAEARKKLQNLEINRKPTGGLSTSMSVANIHRLPLSQKEHSNTLATAPIQKGHNLSATIGSSPGYAENDAVRRSISLSDLSHNQMLGKSLSIKQQVRNKMNSPAFNNVYYPLRNFKGKPDQTDHPLQPQPQGLWGDAAGRAQQQHDPPNGSYAHERLNGLNSSLNTSQNSINQLHHNGSATQHKPIRVRMSRSSSMASINKNDSLLRNQMENYKPQGLWNSPSSLSINTLRSNSSATAQANSSSGGFNNKFSNHSKLAHHHRKSSDDESSSDENDLYHRISQRPSTPPKPNIRQTLRRSSTTSNNLFLTNSNAGGSPAHNSSANFTLQNASNSSTVKSTHKANRKSWGNNFELRPAKSEYNLNSMGQETVNSPSSGFWSNHSNNGHSQTNGSAMTNGSQRPASGKPNDAIDYENFDLTNINPATVPLSTELFQHIVDELNHLGTFAKKVHYRAQAENNQKLQNLLVQGVSKAYVNLATIVPFSSNSVLPITKSLNNKELASSNYHHNGVNLMSSSNLSNNLSNGQHTADSSNTDHDTEEDNNLSSPLNNNATVGHVSLTSDSASSSLPQESLAMNLLQHYSERLLSMMENQMRNSNKDK